MVRVGSYAFFMDEKEHEIPCGVPHPDDTTDCSARSAHTILQAFEICLVGLCFRVVRVGSYAFFMDEKEHEIPCGVPHPDDTTDCSARSAHTILQAFEFRPVGLHSHVCSGLEVMVVFMRA